MQDQPRPKTLKILRGFLGLVRPPCLGVTRGDHVSRPVMETNDPDHDDDQHVRRWQPSNPPWIASYSFRSAQLITFRQLSVWEMVSKRHHEVC
jgi:hypothetical protein